MATFDSRRASLPRFAAIVVAPLLLIAGVQVVAAPEAKAQGWSSVFTVSCSGTKYPIWRFNVKTAPVRVGWGPNKDKISDASGEWFEFNKTGVVSLGTKNGARTMYGQVWASPGELTYPSGTGYTCQSYAR